MTERPYCEAPDACRAVGIGHCRHCHGVGIQARANADPEVRARRSAALKAANARPEVRARRAAANARPEVRARRSAALKAANARPEVRARRSAALKAANARPEVRARRSVRWFEEMDDALRREFAAGTALIVIAKVIGVAYPTLRQRIRALGLTRQLRRAAVAADGAGMLS